ncbi:chromate efflux transporter [Bacterioplanes sanyensis]|nr:chromate efflux transporter [Bacterioplanes sanyensis]
MLDAWQVFRQFFWLGCTSFGGPAAHIGYFRQHFVVQSSSISEQRFADMLALSQFLPGPASSQLGAAIGKDLAGWLGALAAFIGFTLPSVLLLMLFGSAWVWLADSAVILALKWLAMVVVADAVWGMAKTFCRSGAQRWLAAWGGVFMLCLPSWQWGMLLFVAVWGAYRTPIDARVTAQAAAQTSAQTKAPNPLSSPLTATLLLLFVVVLMWSWWGANGIGEQLVALFYRTGASVFGGGHVVLPLLQPELVGQGLLGETQFNAGYGIAQTLPGPLFSVALLFAHGTGAGIGVAMLCLLAIFLPGFLLLFALLNQWYWLQQQPRLVSALAAVNAAVVGLLAATWLSTLVPAGVHSLMTLLLALLAFFWLQWQRSAKTVLLLAGLAVLYFWVFY